MDEDFKIVIAAELDETKSMQNIMASLNHIQAKVKETQIKIPVDVNNANSQQAASNIKQIEKNVVSANKQTKTFGDTLKNALNIGSAAAVTAKAIQLIRNAAKDAVEAVKDFDSAITNLRTATGKDYETVKQWVVSYNQMGQALGATTTEVADSANTWLRQGKTVSEANSLIKTTMMLSKVGMLDSADAAKYLTSAMKGYHVSVEDAVGIVDKLTGVDAHAAVSAGDLAVAMSRTAETAADAGISMDKLLGYLAAVGEVTQKDMSSIGNAFKTVFTRMADIKSGKLELIDVDGTTEILSDVETVLNGLNIKLRKSDNEFRNFGDVLDEVAAKWDTYSDVQQAALAKAFAGTRQQENFRVLMANYDKAREYMDVAADSAGSAEKKFGAYLDSIEAKTKSLQAAFESLAINTFSTEMLGGIIGATAGLVEFLDKAGILKATLLSLGAGATLKGVQMIATGFKNISQNVLNLGESINILRRVGNVSNLTGETIKKLGTLTKGLGSDQLRLVLTSRQLSTAQMQAILMASGLTKEEAAQRLETLGLAASQKTAEGATWSLSSAMQGLGASIKATFVANPIGATMMAISAATVVVSLLANAWEEAKQKAEEARQAMSDAAKAVNDQRNSLADLIAEYKELATAGDFDSSARDTAKRIQQDITDLVGQQAENLDLVNGKLDDEIEKLDNIRLQNAYNARDTLDTKFRDAKSQFEAGVEATDSGTNAFSAYQNEQDALSNLNDLRASTITDGVAVLRELGFAVEYNADANELWISNMEHLNELTADSKGEYSTLQEATNALRKDTEDLIGTLEDLNKENRDGSSTWLELKGSIKDTKLSIVNDLQEIVNKASDAVDEIQNVSDTLYEAADEFAKNDGFITIDTWRALRKVGMQYMQLLKNENNEWEINEERINAVIAARTRQMAVENAMSYVERIKLATQEGAVENLNDLIFVTTDATNSTWGLVYAELELMHIMGDLNDSQYQAALHNSRMASIGVVRLFFVCLR